ncbi:MAG: O-methyltransferase [Acidobacteriota bacterium]|nr:O-methyltransferase [Acidobacteriota bacterium]
MGRRFYGLDDASAQESVTREALNDLVLARLFDERTGAHYPNVNRRAKEELVARIQELNQHIPAGTSWVTQTVLATEILNIPPTVAGNVIECGCWKGASTSSLSLVCALTGRKLIICDSFAGLPDDETQKAHRYPHLGVFGYYQEGMYAARLDEVKSNIAKFGDPTVCEFLPGFFSDSLKSLDGPVAFAFFDVDLESSMHDCIKHIWPLLVDQGRIYTDDSGDMEVVRIWFDEDWWQANLKQPAPGYVGSGCGLPIDPSFSALGYAHKVLDPSLSYGRIAWLYYPDASRPDASQQDQVSVVERP